MLSPAWSFLRRKPASMRAFVESGGVLTSPASQTEDRLTSASFASAANWL